VQAIHDALVAHKCAYTLVRGFLHQDISARNINIVQGHGCLIDWDLETPKDSDMLRPRQSMRTGTREFMSVYLVQNDDTSAPHTLQDDLESFFWVLLWTALMYSDSLGLSSVNAGRTLRLRAYLAFEGKGKEAKARVLSNDFTADLFPDRPLLSRLLKDLAGIFAYHDYDPNPDWGLWQGLRDSMEYPSIMIQRDNGSPIYRHKESLRKMNHGHIIERFAFYLKSDTWPKDDAAVVQFLPRINYWEEDEEDEWEEAEKSYKGEGKA